MVYSEYTKIQSWIKLAADTQTSMQSYGPTRISIFLARDPHAHPECCEALGRRVNVGSRSAQHHVHLENFIDLSPSGKERKTQTVTSEFRQSVTMGVARRARARVVSYRMQLRELRQRQTMEANDRDQAQRERVELTRRRKDCAVCLKPAKYRCARCDAPRFCSKSCRFQHWRQSHKRGGRAGASSSSARGDTD
ncbi:hypothetical protein Mapa_003172 [Marchantia paleacea]|nr:hypothetical protein Mapa_003172 [Marchantia paleacea]